MRTIFIIIFGGFFLGILMGLLNIEVSQKPIEYIILLVCAELYGVAIWWSGYEN